MTTPFSYSVLRYLHDPFTGESVNVGVLMFAPSVSWIRFKGTTRTQALSSLFRGFDRDHFVHFIHALESATKRLQDLLDNSRAASLSSQLPLFDEPRDSRQDTSSSLMARFLTIETRSSVSIGDMAAWLLPDNGLSFQFGEARGGISQNILATHDNLFDRLITKQRPPQRERKRRDHEDVWTTFQKPLRELGITNYLSPHEVQLPQFDDPISFRHAYKNEKWHAVEPVSFDYADASSIREQAFRWYGYGAALEQVEEFAQLYLLLGAPLDATQKKEYAGAKVWLSRMENRPQLIEEDEAADFASELASTMRKEGVLPSHSSEKTIQDNLSI